MSFFISNAYAQSSTDILGSSSFLGQYGFLILMFVAMYFLMIRPQQKRAKEQKNMMEALAKGNEVVTAGGVLGKITKISDAYVTLEVSSGAELVVQKNAITTVLPNGTLKSL